MCFNGAMSACFAAFGLLLAVYIRHRTSNTELATAVFFFFTMELLQAVQYIFIANGLDDDVGCGAFINKLLTVLGYLHICLQPYFVHVANERLRRFVPLKSEMIIARRHHYEFLRRLCLVGGFLLFLRFPMAYLPGYDVTKGSAVGEYLRGDRVCTFKTASMYHLGWSLPFADATYVIQGPGLHFFLIFAPYFALPSWGVDGIVHALILFLTGPFAAMLISSDPQEQGSIWCFFSVAQIAIPVFRTRKILLKEWPVPANNVPES
jgi:hypothetical protein